jgi:hypothetical protein
MQLFRRIFVSIAIAALVTGTVPLSLALECIPSAAQAAAPCQHGGCDAPETPDPGCICIHYPAPYAPGSLAVFDAAPPVFAPVEVRVLESAPPESTAAHAEPPEPPPPRTTPGRA